MDGLYGKPAAAACIKGRRDSGISGTVLFYPRGKGTVIDAGIDGLPGNESGFYGFHIHEGGNCRGEGFANTGGHYNPGNCGHPMHAGDLPPLLECCGKARLVVWTERFCPAEVIGRTVVVHSQPDDFHSQPSGNAGEKIACGVIRKV